MLLIKLVSGDFAFSYYCIALVLHNTPCSTGFEYVNVIHPYSVSEAQIFLNAALLAALTSQGEVRVVY